MRTSLALALVAGLASAQLSKIPACALSCLELAIASSGCSLTDTDCQCTTGQAAIAKSVTPCICKSCTPAEQLQAVEATNGVCEADFKSMGKTYTNTAITLNACEIATGTATSPIISGEQTSAASSTTSAASSATTTPSSSAASSTSGAAGGAGGSTKTSAASSTTSAASSSSAAGGSSASSTPASSAPSSTASAASTGSGNAAPMVTVAAELVFGGVAAAAGYFAL